MKNVMMIDGQRAATVASKMAGLSLNQWVKLIQERAAT